MFGGIPADTVHAGAFQLIDKAKGALLHFVIFRIDVAVTAELVVSYGVAVGVIYAASPAYSAVGIPP